MHSEFIKISANASSKRYDLKKIRSEQINYEFKDIVFNKCMSTTLKQEFEDMKTVLQTACNIIASYSLSRKHSNKVHKYEPF